MWPWSQFRFLEHAYRDIVAQHNDLSTRHNELVTKIAVQAVELRTAERDLERSLAELHLVQQDFKQLVHVTARPVSKTQPIDFSRDPFAEDAKLPDVWLSDDSVLPDIEAIEEIVSGQSEDGERGRPSAREGAEG